MRLSNWRSPIIAAFLSLFHCFPASADTNQAMARDTCEGMGVVVASTVVDLSAFCGNSWIGNGQLWSNAEPTPANSEAQAYSDFHLGDSTAAEAIDPVFTGYAGHHGSYWLQQTDGFFEHEAGAAPSQFFGNMHCKGTCTGAPATWWVYLAFRFVQNDATVNLIGTSNASSVAGWALQSTATEQVFYRRNDGITGTNATILATTDKLVNGVDYVIIFTVDTNTGAWESWLYSSGVAVLNNTGTMSSAIDATLITAATGTMTIGTANRSTSTEMPLNTRVYGVGFGNAVINDTDAANIVTVLEFRSGIDFTP